MKKVLITGITGFVGSHLAELLLDQKYTVFGSVRPRSKTENIDHLRSKVKLFDVDILDSHNLYDLVEDTRPDYIFHLAAQSFVLTSWSSPANTLQTNLIGTVHLFEAVRKLKLDPVIQIACSSEEYGLVKENELPVKETNPLRPLSSYAVSKVAMDMLGYQYFKSYGLKIVRTRGFNHTGPRRGEVFAESTFAKQIAEAEKGLRKPVIEVGNLAARRDYTDVRDMVRAYLLTVQKGEPGEVYNICSEKTWRIKKVLEILPSFSKTKMTVKKDPARMRPSDVLVLLGDCSKFKKQTGWQPKIPFEKTLEDLLNYWRERV